MALALGDPARLALVLVDMQNDFLSPGGAYARGGMAGVGMEGLAERLRPVADAVRDAGGWVVSTHFTLVPGRGGAPLISPHLKAVRPFLGAGDFVPGTWGHALVDPLWSDIQVEKVAHSAFYMSRLELVLRRAGIETLIFSGIVTNGGVAQTMSDAHVRDFRLFLLRDGCAAFTAAVHEAAVTMLGASATVTDCASVVAALGRA